jgi:hypothetical protein
MSNTVYTLKIAEAHLNLITNALAAHPWKDVAQVLASIGGQVQVQRKEAADNAGDVNGAEQPSV